MVNERYWSGGCRGPLTNRDRGTYPVRSAERF